MAYLLQFAGYTLPPTLRPEIGDRSVDLAEQELPRADGSVLQPGRAKSRLLTVRGDLTAADPATLAASLDALRAVCYRGAAGQLFLGRDDRYWLAQVESVGESTSDGRDFGLIVGISIGFRAAQPAAYDVAAVTQNFPSPSGASSYTYTPAGNAPALPTWTITVNQAGTGPLTLTNSTTGEVCTLAGPFSAGDTIVLQRDGYSVSLNGAANFGLLGGRIPRLVPGANTLSLSAGGTATVGAFSVAYTPRWA